MKACLLSILGGQMTQPRLLELALKIAKKRGVKVDRSARRKKELLIVWFCENALDLLHSQGPSNLSDLGGGPVRSKAPAIRRRPIHRLQSSPLYVNSLEGAKAPCSMTKSSGDGTKTSASSFNRVFRHFEHKCCCGELNGQSDVWIGPADLEVRNRLRPTRVQEQ
jgi:hypothetical protein